MDLLGREVYPERTKRSVVSFGKSLVGLLTKTPAAFGASGFCAVWVQEKRIATQVSGPFFVVGLLGGEVYPARLERSGSRCGKD